MIKIIQSIYVIVILIVLFSCDTSKKELTKEEQASKHNTDAINEAKNLLKKGDLIMRMGDDFISEILADIAPVEKKYSHTGIVDIVDNKMLVYSINPESTTGKGDDTIRIESVDSFIQPFVNKRFGIYRFDLNDAEMDSFFVELKRFKKQHIKFDFKFDIKDDNNLYCSELIVKSLEKATNNKLQFKRSIIDDTHVLGVKRFFKLQDTGIDLKKYPILTLDNLYLNPFTKLVYENKLFTKRDYPKLK